MPPPRPVQSTDFEDYPQGAVPPPVRDADEYRDDRRLQELVAENARRLAESLRLYEPSLQVERFHSSTHRQRLLRGGKRSGKSVGAGVEIARALTGQDPYNKYPKRNGVVAAIGLNAEHCGKVMWKYLGGQGVFKIIRDAKTGLWRTWKPRDPEDAARKNDMREAPALIPARFIHKIAWESRAKGIPKIVKFTTGWQLWFYSSVAEVAKGFQGDIVWIDEEITNQQWYHEMRARLIDRGGYMIISATPQAGTDFIYDLACEAEKGNPDVLDVCLLTEENPYLDKGYVESFAAGMTDEERRVALRGEFLLSGLLVYLEYRRGGLHAEPCFPIPHDWARYLAIDPGRQHCAVLFLAVPPPERGNVRYVYDECAIRNCDAELFAQEVAARSRGVVYEAGLIDMHAAGVVEMGSGRSVGEQYLEALKRHGVEFARGAGFVDGSGDAKEKAGVLAVRDWLRLRPDGSVKLKVFEDKCPRLVWEFQRWRYTRDRDGSVKEVTEKRNSDSLDCLRYLAMYDPPYRRPKVRKGADSPAVRAMKAYKKKSRGAGGPCVSLGPRGAEG